MNKKKALTLFAAVALIGAMGVGATLAYFTDTEDATNVVTMGNVNIKLTETSESEDGSLTTGKKIEGGLSFENVVPGETVAKKPVISLDGSSQDAYIRVKMDITMDGATDVQEKHLTDLESALKDQIITANGTWLNSGSGWYIVGDWYYDGEYYYYNNVLDDASDVAVFFESVTIPASWDNSMADAKFNIVLTAEAIQADYLDGVLEYTDLTGTTADGVETTIHKITGWDLDTDDDEVNDIAIEKYTKQTTSTTEESVQ